jgi:DNA invertase Pin-like site-specific DNA recombinase
VILNSKQPSPLRAAQYIRMSTEHQQYSPQNQAEAIAAYAACHGMEIVREYADRGRSGLDIAGREGLRSLLDDATHGRNDFSQLLVFDISRWGRFQDADESAYYEYILKKAGVGVHYCAEPFVNDGNLPSVLFKTLKRTMAGEYSRELSTKVFAGQCRLTELGFRQGGMPGYGFKRLLLDKDGHPKAILEMGEHKSIQNDRIILIPGTAAQIEVIKRIYRSFIDLRMGETAIATDLNAGGVSAQFGKKWTNKAVSAILVNPKYAGVCVYNRRSFKLRQKRVHNPPQMWVQSYQECQQIVSPEDFRTVQDLLLARAHEWSDQELLDRLKALLKQKHRLSSRLIDDMVEMPRSVAYAKRFGGLKRAYTLAGWQPEREYGYVEAVKRVRKQFTMLMESISEEVERIGGTIRLIVKGGPFTINHEFTALVRVARCYPCARGNQWRLMSDLSPPSDITVVARMDELNESILDYYIFPPGLVLKRNFRLHQLNRLELDVYRFDNLEVFLSLCRRQPIDGVA